MSDSTAGLILAAGRATRFGSNKLFAVVGGRPMLQHVLDFATAVGLKPVVVVVGPDHAAVESELTWHGEQIVVNPNPERGLSSSVRLGMSALAASTAERLLVLLGDQPFLAPDQAGRILSSPSHTARPISVPRYEGRPGNPVLLERSAWPLAESLTGDRGMVQVINAHPELVRYIDVPGTNPDIDTAADLAALTSGAGRGRSGHTAGEDRSRP
ncbi:MAG TPA: nucleotidyltransferase family protein [Candidatus Limnocylindrales bacterium]|nr:nucleotidyltransferase family protein [Candidatus Limnocylindrales bacterium]